MKMRRAWAALLATWVAFALVISTGLASQVLRRLGGQSASDFAGVRIELGGQEALDEATLTALRKRLEVAELHGTVRRADASSAIVEIENKVVDDSEELFQVLTATHRVELRGVHSEAPSTMKLRERAQRENPERITVEMDRWEAENGSFSDWYLQGPRDLLLPWIAGESDQRLGTTPQGKLRRTYAVDAEPIVADEDITAAEVMFNPTTARSEVLITLSERGKQRFGEWTGGHIGQKLAILVDDEVHSAPFVAGAITGGKSTITMGAPDETEATSLLHAQQLAVALGAGRLSHSLLALSIEKVNPPPIARTLLIAVSVLLALLAGLLVWLAATLLARLPLTWSGVDASGDGRAPWLRALVTLSALAVVWLMPLVPLPGLNRPAVENIGPDAAGKLNVFAFGLTPVFTAFVLVELVALVVPAWNRRRHAGSQARRPLLLATALLATVLATLQAFFVYTWLGSTGESQIMSGLLAGTDLGTEALIIGSLVCGTLVLVFIAEFLSRFGLVNGYSAMIVATWLVQTVHTLQRKPQPDLPTITSLTILLVVAACLAIALVAGALLAARARLHAHGPTLRLPSSGIVPLAYATGVVAVVPIAAQLGMPVPMKVLEWLAAGSVSYFGVQLLVAVALAGLASWLFSMPAPVAGLVSDLRTRAADPRSLARLWSVATAVSVAWLVLLALAGAFLGRNGPRGLDFLGPVVLAAVVLDALGEWRARRRLGDLVAVAERHDVQGVDAALAVLAAADVPAFARTAHHRVLLHFFAPFLPVVIAVPPAHAQRAREVLSS